MNNFPLWQWLSGCLCVCALLADAFVAHHAHVDAGLSATMGQKAAKEKEKRTEKKQTQKREE